MKYHELNITKHKVSKRLGRGISSGSGKTAGRGTKGQNARAGSSRKPGFEGGQNPLMQRLPKLRGFKSHSKVVDTVSTGQINELSGVIDNTNLAKAGLVANPHTRVKLLLKGEVTKKLDVKLQLASASAVTALQQKGGSFIATSQVGRQPKTSDTKSK